ncbi:MAG: response regulator [Opitutaceae bacterium]|nr:response regulator [Cytophagales bacterium]
MSKELGCIMLIDDNPDDNFFHEREIKKYRKTTNVITKDTGIGAFEYLQAKEKPRPDLIFLDINMPGMNGWEFLQVYRKLDKSLQTQIIIMLTTSENPDDASRAKGVGYVSDYLTKPLTKEVFGTIINKYFND